MTQWQTAVERIVPQDDAWRTRARARLEQLCMPHWALGRLMDLAEDLAGMTRSVHPPVGRKVVAVLAADHGVAAEGVSKYPPDVTAQMVRNFTSGGAGINALAANVGAHVLVVDMGVAAPLEDLVADGKIVDKRIAPGTENLARGPAMTRAQAEAALDAGVAVARDLAPSTDVFGTGDMGIANTTPSAAVLAVLAGCPVAEATGRGTGIDEDQRQHKIEVIERAVALNKPDANDGVDVLAKVGGFEIGGLAGLMLGAAACRKPVVVDGFISTAGALVAHRLCPAVAEYMIAGHQSQEIGHRIMLAHLNKRALLDLDFRLGEGTGAAVAMHLVDGAARILTDVATFAEAAVSEADK